MKLTRTKTAMTKMANLAGGKSEVNRPLSQTIKLYRLFHKYINVVNNSYIKETAELPTLKSVLINKAHCDFNKLTKLSINDKNYKILVNEYETYIKKHVHKLRKQNIDNNFQNNKNKLLTLQIYNDIKAKKGKKPNFIIYLHNNEDLNRDLTKDKNNKNNDISEEGWTLEESIKYDISKNKRDIGTFGVPDRVSRARKGKLDNNEKEEKSKNKSIEEAKDDSKNTKSMNNKNKTSYTNCLNRTNRTQSAHNSINSQEKPENSCMPNAINKNISVCINDKLQTKNIDRMLEKKTKSASKSYENTKMPFTFQLKNKRRANTINELFRRHNNRATNSIGEDDQPPEERLNHNNYVNHGVYRDNSHQHLSVPYGSHKDSNKRKSGTIIIDPNNLMETKIKESRLNIYTTEPKAAMNDQIRMKNYQNIAYNLNDSYYNHPKNDMEIANKNIIDRTSAILEKKKGQSFNKCFTLSNTFNIYNKLAYINHYYKQNHRNRDIDNEEIDLGKITVRRIEELAQSKPSEIIEEAFKEGLHNEHNTSRKEKTEEAVGREHKEYPEERYQDDEEVDFLYLIDEADTDEYKTYIYNTDKYNDIKNRHKPSSNLDYTENDSRLKAGHKLSRKISNMMDGGERKGF